MSAKDVRDWLIRRGGRAPRSPHSSAATFSGASHNPVRGIAAATIGLTLAGGLAPGVVAMVAASETARWHPLLEGALFALLVLAPTSTALSAAAVYLRRGVIATHAAFDAEYAVLRVLIVAVLFGYALAWPDGDAGNAVPLVAPWLLGAWVMLACILLRPTITAPARYGAMAADLALFSGFLHLGGGDVVAWYPLYLAAIFYTGLRFGIGALAATTAASIVGFTAIVLTTECWRQQLLLAAGLIGGLGVLPGFVAGAIRSIAAARVAARQAETNRQQTLLLIADALRRPIGLIGAGAPPVDIVVDFAGIEAGAFAPAPEALNLRASVKQSLLPVQARAAEKGIALRWRIDPLLPDRLRGPAQAVTRILSALVDHAIEAAQDSQLRIAIDAGERKQGEIDLRIRLDGRASRTADAWPEDDETLAGRLVRRLVEFAGGNIATDRIAGQGRFAITLPFTIEAGAAEPVPDLQRRPVLLVTEDDEVARTLAEPLATWNGEPLWPGSADEALADALRYGSIARPIMIIDGRDGLLSALGLANRAARADPAPSLLLLAEAEQIAKLADVDSGELDGFIAAPVSEQMLARVLNGLPLEPVRPLPSLAPPETTSAASALPEAERIAAIAAHPKYVPDPAAAVDERAIERLHNLGDGTGFMGELVETFVADARQIMRRLAAATASADADGFARGIVALRRAAAHLGGVQLCELAASLQLLSTGELRDHGQVHLQRLDSEIDRVAAALTELVPLNEAKRR